MSTERPLTPEILYQPPTPISSRWQDYASLSSADARARLPLDLAQRFEVLPSSLVISPEGTKALILLAGKHLTYSELQELRFAASCDVILETCDNPLLKTAIPLAYRAGTEHLSEYIAACASPEMQSTLEDPSILSQPIPAILATLITRAYSLSASDIHIEPSSNFYRVRLRIDGILREDSALKLPSHVADSLIRRIKVLSQLDHCAIHKPLDGSFSFDGTPPVRIRVSCIPLANGEKIALRILDDQFLESLGKDPFPNLGLSPRQCQFLRTAIGGDQGLFVVSGPTGSGKSTLLSAILQVLNNGLRNMITLEDPVERLIPGINQVEIRPDLGLGYADLLPPLLRQDPDVILVGEIREEITARIACSASLTGHLVLTTLHAANCIESFIRLSRMVNDLELFCTAVRMLVSQRLIPLNCTECLVRVSPNPLTQRIFAFDRNQLLAQSRGCSLCRNTGYRGRLGVFEVLPFTAESKRILVENGGNASDEEFQQISSRLGYRPFAHSVREALLSHRIAPAAALRAIGLDGELIIGEER